MPVSASPARPDYHAPSTGPAKTGHFYFAENRTFLLCVDRLAKNSSWPAISVGHADHVTCYKLRADPFSEWRTILPKWRATLAGLEVCAT